MPYICKSTRKLTAFKKRSAAASVLSGKVAVAALSGKVEVAALPKLLQALTDPLLAARRLARLVTCTGEVSEACFAIRNKAASPTRVHSANEPPSRRALLPATWQLS